MSEPSGERWITVAEVVRETGAPERTLYRWIKAKRLPTRSSGGVATVELGAIRLLAASRPATGGPALSGRAGGGTGGGSSDPEIDSLILARLDQGDRPLDIVRDLRVAPRRVREMGEEHAKLKAMEKGPSAAEQIAALQDAQNSHSTKINALMEAVGELGAALEDLKRRLSALPFPPSRDAHICGGRGARGLYVVPLRCSCCGREQPFGFYPQRSI